MTTNELYTPGPEDSIDPIEYFEKIFTGLPLEGSYAERYQHTGRLEFIAPPDVVFRMSGDFLVEQETNDGSHLMTPPEESLVRRAKNKKVNPQSYEDDEHFFYDWYTPRRYFFGPRLTVSINYVPYGQVLYPRDLQDLEHSEATVRVHIAGPTGAGAMDGVAECVLEERNGSGLYRPYFYDRPLSIIHWSYEEAIGRLGGIKIHQVPDRLPTPKLKVITRGDWSEQIWSPSNAPTSEAYSKYHESAYGVPLTTEQKLALIRQSRLEGWPLDDDPLKDLWVVREDEEGHVSADKEMAARIEKWRSGPQSFFKIEAQRRRELREHYRRERAEKLRGSLAVIGDLGSLEQIVERRAGPDWLERDQEEWFRNYDREF